MIALRKKALSTAIKEGFKPTSKDAWINEQQGIEFLRDKKLSKLVKEAEKTGFKPTSSDDVINEAQARAALKKSKQDKPKLAEKSPALEKAIAGAKPPKTNKQRKELAQKVAKVPLEDVWENYKKVAQAVQQWNMTRFKQEAVNKIQASTKKIVDRMFSPNSLIARVSAKLLGEPQF